MGDAMSRNLASATSGEETSIKDSEELMAAKKKQVNALTASIETKTQRIGELLRTDLRPALLELNLPLKHPEVLLVQANFLHRFPNTYKTELRHPRHQQLLEHTIAYSKKLGENLGVIAMTDLLTTEPR